MDIHRKTELLSGVIEGFYGQPWSQSERLELFEWMAAWGLNTYFYAPKDDLKHRFAWREPYTAAEAADLKQLIQACRNRGHRFIYALGPGLDIEFADDKETELIARRFEQLIGLGCENFALLFDDIPDRMTNRSAARWGSFAKAQAHVANATFRWVNERCRNGRFLFCPTAYCGRMLQRQLGGEGYLPTIGRELLPEIDIFWTGPEIVSREITAAHAREIGTILRRKPLIWDNLHANDYDGRRFFCGPYAGRAPELREEVSGLLTNPNCEFQLNYVPIRTLAEFLQAGPDWNPRQAYLTALREWRRRFDSSVGPVDFEDLILLMDCYYLPHEEGPAAEVLYRAAQRLVTTSPEQWGEQLQIFRNSAARLWWICERLPAVAFRPLFYALNRRIWELREELQLLEGYIEYRAGQKGGSSAYRSNFHLPGTFRGGMVARLQQLLSQHPDGTFTPSSS